MLFPQIRGTPWTTDYEGRRINVTNLDTNFDVKDLNNPQFTATVQQSLQPGTNCTFYLCYKQGRKTVSDRLGRTSPVSCVLPGKSLNYAMSNNSNSNSNCKLSSCHTCVVNLIGVSLSKPHTSVPALAEVVCIFACGHIP